MRPLTEEEVAREGGDDELRRRLQQLQDQAEGRRTEPLRRIPPKRTVAIGVKMHVNGHPTVVRKITDKDVFMRRLPADDSETQPIKTGQHVVINAALFKVHKITRKDVVLRSQPQRGRDAGPKDGAVE
jgi:hypothetical protein